MTETEKIPTTWQEVAQWEDFSPEWRTLIECPEGRKLLSEVIALRHSLATEFAYMQGTRLVLLWGSVAMSAAYFALFAASGGPIDLVVAGIWAGLAYMQHARRPRA